MYLHELPGRPEKPIKIYGLKGGKVGEKAHDMVVLFHHLDGMYSYCTVEGDKDAVIHLSAATPIEKYEDGYKVVEDK